ncbi:DUF3516 domain-containing protein, partial [Endomicrobium sp. AH-315-J14]|nr:DUF3516 domain-containing protein [Endomicrobium sp. AH-315-J14]
RYGERGLHDAIEQLIEDDEAPIYLVNFTQKGAHSEAQNLMSVNVCSKDEKKLIAAFLDGFRFDTAYGKILQRFLRHGIGVHHGGMLPKYRRLVERLAQRGLLKVISGTDTLGVGVNVPLRSVVMTKLCKYDGEKTDILTVRDFHQICGRAGRKGFDDKGTVVVQAPEHVVENIKLAAKKSGGKKKVVNKKPPQRGYVHWNRATFDKLVGGQPEPLQSRFAVSHSMLFNVLSRPEGGCEAMKSLVKNCHDRSTDKRRHRKTGMQMLRSLVDAGIMSLEDKEHGAGKKIIVNTDLQPEFGLMHSLSLWAVETIENLDPDRETYALDVLSVIEAILENPRAILYKQIDRLKGELVAKLKAEGVEYDERMAELEKVDYPKPNAEEFIYLRFNEFAAKHAYVDGVAGDIIRPKGVAREVFENFSDFNDFTRDYKLQGSEGVVLRYLSNVYKTLVQTVPARARDERVDELIDFFDSIIRVVDSSLLEEWEQKRDPDWELTQTSAAPEREEQPKDLIADKKSFTVMVRNAAFRLVRALSLRDYELAAELVLTPEDQDRWSLGRFRECLAGYYEEFKSIRTDPSARGTRHITIEQGDTHWTVRQVLVDPDDHNDWVVELSIDLAASAEQERPVMYLDRMGS